MSTGTVGNTAWTQQGWDAPGSGFAAASQFTMPADGWITTLHGYFDSTSGSGNGWLCVWRASDGALLASNGPFATNVGSLAAGGQTSYSKTLVTPLFVASGTNIYIGFYCDQGLVWSSGTGGTSKIDSEGGSGPTSFTPGASPIGVIEAYADYATGNGKVFRSSSWVIGPVAAERSGNPSKGLAKVYRSGVWTAPALG
jgi:hypothetical protein